MYASNTDGSEWYAEDPNLTKLFEAAEEDTLYSAICSALERMNAGPGKLDSVPRDTPALEWLHDHKEQWPDMGILRNARGQRLIWLNGEQIFVPYQCRPGILATVDSVHNGPRRASQLARRSYWWPHMDKDIDDHCQLCPACKEFNSAPPKETSLATPIPPMVGHTQGMDFAEVSSKTGGKRKFLLLTDYLSGWATYFEFPSAPTSASVIDKLSKWFHSSTWPAILASDGEGVFTSAEFKAWMAENGIIHRQSSVNHPQSNGLAEAAVKTFKRLWEKCKAMGDSFHSAWSFWMDTPRKPGEMSPSRMWFGRQIRHPQWHTPFERAPADTIVAAQEAYIRRKEEPRAFRQDSAPFAHAHGTVMTPRVGTHVLVREKDCKTFSIPAIIMSLSLSGRSARVRLRDTGEFWLRNRSGIRLDPNYLRPAIISSSHSPVSSSCMSSKDSQAGGVRQKRRVSFADQATVAEFSTTGWRDETGKVRRIGTGGVRPSEPIATFYAESPRLSPPQAATQGAQSTPKDTASPVPGQSGPMAADAPPVAPPPLPEHSSTSTENDAPIQANDEHPGDGRHSHRSAGPGLDHALPRPKPQHPPGPLALAVPGSDDLHRGHFSRGSGPQAPKRPKRALFSSTLFSHPQGPNHVSAIPTQCPARRLPRGAGHDRARFPGVPHAVTGQCSQPDGSLPPRIQGAPPPPGLRPAIRAQPPCTLPGGMQLIRPRRGRPRGSANHQRQGALQPGLLRPFSGAAEKFPDSRPAGQGGQAPLGQPSRRSGRLQKALFSATSSLS